MISLGSGEEGSPCTLTPACPSVFGAARVSGSPSLGLMPQCAPIALWVANTLTQPTELSPNPLCPEIARVGHQGVCKVLFGLRVKFIADLKADLPSPCPCLFLCCPLRPALQASLARMLEGTGCLSVRKPNFAELSEQGTPGCQLISQRREKNKK